MTLIFIFIIPVYEYPDEPQHLNYINTLSRTLQLPNQYDQARIVPEEGHQPPLYYMLCAALCRLTQNDNEINITLKVQAPTGSLYYPHYPVFDHLSSSGFHTNSDRAGFYSLRILSMIIGLINLLFIFKIVKLFFKDDTEILICIFMAASLPQFIFISSGINNDNLADMFSSMMIYFLFVIISHPEKTRNFALGGIILGLGLLTKKTLLFFIPAAFFIMLYHLFFMRRFFEKDNIQLERYPKKYFFNITIFFYCMLAICGWWYIRNLVLYSDILGNEMERRTLPHLISPKPLFSVYFLSEFWKDIYKSFIWKYGWFHFGAPKIVYIFFAAIIFGGFLGVIKHLVREHFRDVKVIFSMLLIILCLSGVVYYNLTFTQPQGRFLFPVLSLIVILIVKGLLIISERIREKTGVKVLCKVLIGIFIFINLLCIIKIRNFYAEPSQYNIAEIKR